jgi:hypothetical protein
MAINPLLEKAHQILNTVDADTQFKALKQVLGRTPVLEEGLEKTLKKAKTAKSLAALLASEDETARNTLPIIILSALNAASAHALLLEAKALFEKAQKECTESCLRALPQDVIEALAKPHGIHESSRQNLEIALQQKFNIQTYNHLFQLTSDMVPRSEGQRLWSILQAPAHLSLPAWLADNGLLEDVEDRLRPFPAFLALVRNNRVGWPPHAKFAVREDLASAPFQLNLLSTLWNEVGSHDLERLVEWLIIQLGESDLPQVDEWLACILHHHPYLDRGVAAIRALQHRKGPVVRAALLDRLTKSKAEPPSEQVLRSATRAIYGLIAMDPNDVEGFRGYFDPQECTTPYGQNALQSVLYALSEQPLTRWKASADQWAALASPVFFERKNESNSAAARCLLNVLPEKTLAKVVPPPQPAPRAMEIQSPQWLARYQAGEHEQVWEEMVQAGLAVFECEEALMVARCTMDRVKQEIQRVISILHQGHYAFAQDKPMWLPSDTFVEDLDALEGLLGHPIPLSFRAFHETIGMVDLMTDSHGKPTSAFKHMKELDPLQVAPMEVMLDIAREALQTEESSWAPPLRLPIDLFFGMSPSRKADPDQDEDGPYLLETAGLGADGIVHRGNHPPISFIHYLRSTLAQGGFANLDAHPNAPTLRARLNEGRIPF